MTELTPEQEWWTASEIADAKLPHLPATRKGVELLAKRNNWRCYPHLARRRSGRGGGWEYSWRLFPSMAQRKLLVAITQASQPTSSVEMDRDEAWDWFDRMPDAVKTEAHARLLILQKVEALEPALGKNAAVNAIASIEKPSPRTIWNWFSMVEFVREDDRLPYLAPRHRAAKRKDTKKDMSPEFFDLLKSDYLRSSGPSFSTAYRRATRAAEANGWTYLPEATVRRRFKATVSRETQILARKGVDALKRFYPAQTRDKTALHAMEAVNADFHKFDVFVRWPLMPGEDKPYIGRPQMVAFQDIFSGRILAWRVDQTPNAEAVRLVAGDMLDDYGIPEHILLDNGREFAAKALTGGSPTRYRFKVREDDLPGLFTALGCKIHWATPYSGQSKPIERAFRDMCDNIAKDPRFDGAYTGNRPDAKPEDYGSRAINLDEFLSVLSEGIEEHNMREGRRSEVAFGRSFAEVFDASYAEAPIKKATEAQRRLWLMGAEGLRGDSKSGQLRFLGNEYWSPWMSEIAGSRVIARFDPAALWDGLHVYSSENEYLGLAQCKLKSGFFDIEEARAHSKARRAWLNAEKTALAAHRRLKASEIGDVLNRIDAPATPDKVEAKVVRPVFRKPDPEPKAKPQPDVDEAQASIVADLASRRPVKEPEESARERFKRALDLERKQQEGGEITKDQQRWLSSYQNTPEYAAERLLWEDFGDAMFR